MKDERHRYSPKEKNEIPSSLKSISCVKNQYYLRLEPLQASTPLPLRAPTVLYHKRSSPSTKIYSTRRQMGELVNTHKNSNANMNPSGTLKTQCISPPSLKAPTHPQIASRILHCQKQARSATKREYVSSKGKSGKTQRTFRIKETHIRYKL